MFSAMLCYKDSTFIHLSLTRYIPILAVMLFSFSVKHFSNRIKHFHTIYLSLKDILHYNEN